MSKCRDNGSVLNVFKSLLLISHQQLVRYVLWDNKIKLLDDHTFMYVYILLYLKNVANKVYSVLW